MRHNSEDMEWWKIRRQCGREESNVVLYLHWFHHVYKLAYMCILTTISGIRMNVS